ncbi:MAG: hypothetical protein IJ088_11055 [Clostridia bacterium]|nr:hypothetical protein [Clostridia bacterium]
MQNVEGSTKFVLARHAIEEIIVIGDEEYTEKGGATEPIRLKDAGLHPEETAFSPAFSLFCTQIAQYINEQNTAQQECHEMLPEGERAKLRDFVQRFFEANSQQETKRINRFF